MSFVALYRRVVGDEKPFQSHTKDFPTRWVFPGWSVLKILVVLPFPPPSVAVSMAVYDEVRLVAHEYYVNHVVMLLSPVVPKEKSTKNERRLPLGFEPPADPRYTGSVLRQNEIPRKKISSCVSDCLSLSGSA